MTDKEKILKAINQKQQEIWPTDTGEMAPATVPNNLEQGWLNALKWMKDFINSLPAEQPSEYLEEEIKRKYKSYNTLMMPIENFRKLIIHFTNWQKQQTIDKACEWLRYCIDVDDEVKMIDGEPEAKSFIQKNIHRIKVTNQIMEDFKKATEQ